MTVFTFPQRLPKDLLRQMASTDSTLSIFFIYYSVLNALSVLENHRNNKGIWVVIAVCEHLSTNLTIFTQLFNALHAIEVEHLNAMRTFSDISGNYTVCGEANRICNCE